MHVRHRIPTNETSRQTGLSPTTLSRKTKEDPTFPKPIYIGNKKLFYQDEVSHWIAANERSTPAFNNLHKKSQNDQIETIKESADGEESGEPEED